MELNHTQNREDEKDVRIHDLQQGLIESEAVLANFQAEMERGRRNFAEELKTKQREVNALGSQLLISESALTRKGHELQQKEGPGLQAAVKRAAEEKNAWQGGLDQRQGEIDRLRADLERSADKLASAQKVIEKEIANRRKFEEENIQMKSGVAEAQLKLEQVEKNSQIEFLRKSLEKELAVEKEREKDWQKLRGEEKRLEAEFKTKMGQLLESLYEVKGDEIDAMREQLESQTRMGVEKLKEKEKHDRPGL